VNAGVPIILNAVSTTSPAYFRMSINNDASFRKLVEFTGGANSSAAFTPKVYSGSAVWNETTDSITNIVFQSGNLANTITAGSRIFVYGN